MKENTFSSSKDITEREKFKYIAVLHMENEHDILNDNY